MQWLIDAIMETERVYMVKPDTRELYALGAVRIRYVNGDISLGGEVLSCDPPRLPSDGIVLQMWDDGDRLLELLRFDIDIFSNGNDTYFNATSVRGMSSVLYSSEEDSAVMKTVSVTL